MGTRWLVHTVQLYIFLIQAIQARKQLQRRHLANEHRAEAEVARRENEDSGTRNGDVQGIGIEWCRVVPHG